MAVKDSTKASTDFYINPDIHSCFRQTPKNHKSTAIDCFGSRVRRFNNKGISTSTPGPTSYSPTIYFNDTNGSNGNKYDINRGNKGKIVPFGSLVARDAICGEQGYSNGNGNGKGKGNGNGIVREEGSKG